MLLFLEEITFIQIKVIQYYKYHNIINILMKEFIKPTIAKAIITLVTFLFIPILYYDTGIRCITTPCPASANGSIIQYLLHGFGIHQVLWLNIILGIIGAYIFSCGIIYFLNKK